MKPKFAKCRPVGIDTALIRRLSRRRSQASRYCPEFGLSRARNEAPKRACRRRLTVLEAVPEPRPTPSRRAARPTALCWPCRAPPATSAGCPAFNARSNFFPLVIPASMSTTARLEELKRDLAQMEKRGSRTRRAGSESDRGREADHPGEIPPKGWMDVLWRAWGRYLTKICF